MTDAKTTTEKIFDVTLKYEPFRAADETEKTWTLPKPPGTKILNVTLEVEAYSDAEPPEAALIVWFNGREVIHLYWAAGEGGYKRGSADVTSLLQEENKIRLRFERPGASVLMPWGRTCHVTGKTIIRYKGLIKPKGYTLPKWAVNAMTYGSAAVAVTASAITAATLIKRPRQKSEKVT